MLTRAAVAKRLGRSIATVRRLEGNQLHPWTDERGVHRFDPAEVEDLANRGIDEAALGSVATATHAHELDAMRDQLHRASLEIEDLRELLGSMERTAAIAQDRLRVAQREEQRLRSTAVEALELVGVVLGQDTPYGVRATLRDLRRAS